MSDNNSGPFQFTVIWGRIGTGTDYRFDHVEVAEPTFEKIMDVAFGIVFNEWEADSSLITLDDPESFCWDELRLRTSYDGYAILDGHIPESVHAGFM